MLIKHKEHLISTARQHPSSVYVVCYLTFCQLFGIKDWNQAPSIIKHVYYLIQLVQIKHTISIELTQHDIKKGQLLRKL